jgi:aconitate hydratase
MVKSIDSFKCYKTLRVGGVNYGIFSLIEAERNGLNGISQLPYSLKILLENLLRHEDGRSVTRESIQAVANWLVDLGTARVEVSFRPSRVLMHDFTGVPALVDLAAMRDAIKTLGGKPEMINPLVPVDLVVDHSVSVDEFGTPRAFSRNVEIEYERNQERYRFLKWGQSAFKNFRVVPPGTGICHQVNLEYLGQVVWTGMDDEDLLAYPDTCVGTDSHTTMINGMGVLGWGVGGIEAEAAMLGQPISMLLPEVIGFRLVGALREGVTATDLVLTVTQMLRKKGVVGKFVEFFGPGLSNMTLADRATIANMAPEYGATCGFAPVDGETIRYLKTSGRAFERIELVEVYLKEQGLWRADDMADPVFTDTLDLDLAEVVSSMAGPKRPEGRMPIGTVASDYHLVLKNEYGLDETDQEERFSVPGKDYDLGHGDVVIAAITSCTNTSNPGVLVGAGLIARNANRLGLRPKPWVKTSLAPGSQVVAEYLDKADLQKELDRIGFNVVGFGCTTCIGNSGPLPEPISRTINDKSVVAAAVISGNRNFEGRVSPDVQTNYLASPMLVVAYALAGSVRKDLTVEPIGTGVDGNPVYLRDIWPTSQEIRRFIEENVTRDLFLRRYADVFQGDENWRNVHVKDSETYEWDDSSTYVRNPPYFIGLTEEIGTVTNVRNARILGIFGDKITTDHISPAGSIKTESPAGSYLMSHDIRPVDFNLYGTRRGNHEVMMRGAWANIRIKNKMLGPDPRSGGYTIHYPSGDEMTIYDAAVRYRSEGIPLVVFAGKEYGNGSSRDWAAKGPNLLGVRAVVAQSFERIHRSNLIGMGVMPLISGDEISADSLRLKGNELITIMGLDHMRPRDLIPTTITYADGSTRELNLRSGIDTEDELDYFKNGGILQYVARSLAA